MISILSWLKDNENCDVNDKKYLLQRYFGKYLCRKVSEITFFLQTQKANKQIFAKEQTMGEEKYKAIQ